MVLISHWMKIFFTGQYTYLSYEILCYCTELFIFSYFQIVRQESRWNYLYCDVFSLSNSRSFRMFHVCHCKFCHYCQCVPWQCCNCFCKYIYSPSLECRYNHVKIDVSVCNHFESFNRWFDQPISILMSHLQAEKKSNLCLISQTSAHLVKWFYQFYCN